MIKSWGRHREMQFVDKEQCAYGSNTRRQKNSNFIDWFLWRAAGDRRAPPDSSAPSPAPFTGVIKPQHRFSQTDGKKANYRPTCESKWLKLVSLPPESCERCHRIYLLWPQGSPMSTREEIVKLKLYIKMDDVYATEKWGLLHVSELDKLS